MASYRNILLISLLVIACLGAASQVVDEVGVYAQGARWQEDGRPTNGTPTGAQPTAKYESTRPGCVQCVWVEENMDNVFHGRLWSRFFLLLMDMPMAGCGGVEILATSRRSSRTIFEGGRGFGRFRSHQASSSHPPTQSEGS